MQNAAILMVDDEKTILDSLRGQLRNLFGRRFAYETAADATEAWEVLEELHDRGTRVVVVVSDWLMPGTRGDEFLASVRSRFPDIGRILLTGQADTDAIQRAWDVAQVSDVIHKPWSSDGLRRAIESAMVGL
ncbi:MAG: response regulator [Deltaproteobacteria bacterium]|nr:response regulator [Deltaproteobacteria bacterium]MCB9787887.1 response regulator [Deltaproteobacteria bacterium]